MSSFEPTVARLGLACCLLGTMACAELDEDGLVAPLEDAARRFAAAEQEERFTPEGFEGLRVGGTSDTLARALRGRGTTRRFGPGSWVADVDADGNCHVQGIALAGHRVVTSCVDREHGVGWLQMFDADDPTEIPRASPEGVEVRRLGTIAPHPAVGQPVTRVDGAVVFPVAREGLGGSGRGPEGPARVDLRDAQGELLCWVEHAEPGGLAAAALTAYADAFWLVSISGRDVFVDRLDAIDRSGGPCRVHRVSAQRGSVLTEGGSWRSYQALVLVRDGQGALSVLASQDDRIDAWSVEGFGTAAMRWVWLQDRVWRPWGALFEGVFHEGMTVQMLGEHTLRIWAMPHDYWRGLCRPRRPGARCTRAIYALDLPWPAAPPLVDVEGSDRRG